MLNNYIKIPKVTPLGTIKAIKAVRAAYMLRRVTEGYATENGIATEIGVEGRVSLATWKRVIEQLDREGIILVKVEDEN